MSLQPVVTLWVSLQPGNQEKKKPSSTEGSQNQKTSLKQVSGYDEVPILKGQNTVQGSLNAKPKRKDSLFYIPHDASFDLPFQNPREQRTDPPELEG